MHNMRFSCGHRHDVCSNDHCLGRYYIGAQHISLHGRALVFNDVLLATQYQATCSLALCSQLKRLGMHTIKLELFFKIQYFDPKSGILVASYMQLGTMWSAQETRYIHNKVRVVLRYSASIPRMAYWSCLVVMPSRTGDYEFERLRPQ